MLNEVFILAKIKEGDIKAFEELFRRYYSPLCWYAASMTREMDVAEEIVEELFYNLWKRREEIKILKSIKSYLYGAVRREVFQYCEHQKVRNMYREKVLATQCKETCCEPEESIEYKELERLINDTLRKLPERRRTIFKMHRVDGKKYSEIASLLSLSVKTVEAEMTKTLRILRIEIENYIQTT